MYRVHNNRAIACALTQGGSRNDDAPVSNDERLTGYPDSLLKQEMLRVGLSIQGLAKLMAGPGASHAQREAARTSIRRWLRQPKMGITAKSSAALAPHFGKPSDHFVRPSLVRPEKTNRLEELAASVVRANERLDEAVSTLAEHEARLANLEAALQRRPTRSTHPAERPA